MTSQVLILKKFTAQFSANPKWDSEFNVYVLILIKRKECIVFIRISSFFVVDQYIQFGEMLRRDVGYSVDD